MGRRITITINIVAENILEHLECYSALPENTVAELDAHDRVARRDAARVGRTHPVACRHAITASGKRVGRVGA